MPKRVLIVDDNDVDRLGVMELLRREGFEVAEAREGREALHYLAGHPCDAVILDMLMDGVDGWEFLEVRRRTSSLRATPVLVMTGLLIATEPWAEEMGAAGLIHKPVKTEELLEKLANLMAQAA